MVYGTIQKWGNSQGIRLPKAVLAAAMLGENDAVEIDASEDGIVIRKVRHYRDLHELFAGYSGDYVPTEFDTGSDVGLEVLD